MKFSNLLIVAFLGFVSTALGCNMHEWKMPAAPKRPVNVQGADMPIPDGAGGGAAPQKKKLRV